MAFSMTLLESRSRPNRVSRLWAAMTRSTIASSRVLGRRLLEDFYGVDPAARDEDPDGCGHGLVVLFAFVAPVLHRGGVYIVDDELADVVGEASSEAKGQRQADQHPRSIPDATWFPLLIAVCVVFIVH